MECLTTLTGKRPKVPVEVVGGVLNYCDPIRFDSISFPSDRRWRVAVGIHPKWAKKVTGTEIQRLGEILQNPAVVGVSELGLDHSVPYSEYGAQTELLRRILLLPHITQKVLVIHLRGSEKDPLGITVHNQCRDYLRQRCGMAQRIHLHCTTTGAEGVKEWLRYFPKTCFGFTARVGTFREQQKKGLRAVPLNRLLLESDAPYMPPPSAKGHASTSAYLGETALMVAKVLDRPVQEVCAVSVQNATWLYSLQLMG